MAKRDPKLVAMIEVQRAERMIEVGVKNGWAEPQLEQWRKRLERSKATYDALT